MSKGNCDPAVSVTQEEHKLSLAAISEYTTTGSAHLRAGMTRHSDHNHTSPFQKKASVWSTTSPSALKRSWTEAFYRSFKLAIFWQRQGFDQDARLPPRISRVHLQGAIFHFHCGPRCFGTAHVRNPNSGHRSGSTGLQTLIIKYFDRSLAIDSFRQLLLLSRSQLYQYHPTKSRLRNSSHITDLLLVRPRRAADHGKGANPTSYLAAKMSFPGNLPSTAIAVNNFTRLCVSGGQDVGSWCATVKHFLTLAFHFLVHPAFHNALL
ncbi:hypothetical protein Anapl_01235 [Anas platyrhynchos]|uniref:Uncharacterized protein n=1 Tax=Anas platyrhynchos TaxID=8839 RepID=R0K8M9_ANAPL|nr:hypothetical protein Anapl_01235 [Anas platyrhynchos]